MRVIIFWLNNCVAVVVSEFVVYKSATNCQTHLCEGLFALTMPHTLLKMTFVN